MQCKMCKKNLAYNKNLRRFDMLVGMVIQVDPESYLNSARSVQAIYSRLARVLGCVLCEVVN